MGVGANYTGSDPERESSWNAVCQQVPWITGPHDPEFPPGRIGLSAGPSHSAGERRARTSTCTVLHGLSGEPCIQMYDTIHTDW
jgi:hypothetical protein